MTERLESLLGRRLDAPTSLALAAAAVGIVFAAFLLLRRMTMSFAPPRVESIEAETTLADELRQRSRRRTLSQKFDAAFEGLVESTGLGLSAEQMLGWILLAGAFGAIGLYVARPLPAMALLGGSLGMGLTLLVVLMYQGRQRWRIREQLPEIFFMMARSARAGLSIEKAIEMIGQEKKILISPEFRRAGARIDLGMPAVAALDRMSSQLKMLDFDGLVAIVALHQTSGGNLPMLLERLASSTREHNQLHSYVRTSTSLGRTAALCIGMATPVILLGYAIVQPEFAVSFFQSAYGWIMVAAALALDVVGGLWLYFLLKIEH